MPSFTKIYLTTKAAPFTPATIRGAWDDTAGAVTKALDTLKGDGGAITSVARAETNASATFDVLLYRGVSGPLAAQTISGTIDVVLGILESSASADFCYHLHVYVTQGNSDTPRGTLLTDYVETTANEWPTTATGRGLASAQTLSSLAISAGDRLVVEIGLIARNSVTTSFTGTLRYGTQDPTTLVDAPDLAAADTAVTTKAGFLSFSSAITFADQGTRISQSGAEVANAGASSVRFSAVGTEVIHTGASSFRSSQVGLEVATPNAVSPQQISQSAVEVSIAGVDGIATVEVSQCGVEVARAAKETVLKIKGHYSGGSGYRASSGEGRMTVKR